jgi:chromosome segregation ATPase
MTSHRLATLVVLLVLASSLPAAELRQLERRAAKAHAQHERLLGERAEQAAQALLLADEIARLKARKPSTRADRELEGQLRAFERAAGQLDELDRRIASADRQIQRAERDLGEAAAEEMAQLLRNDLPAEEMARQLAVLQAVRERFKDHRDPASSVRPALDIELAPTDGPNEIETKLSLLRAERERIAREMLRNQENVRLVTARLELKNDLVRELEAARRDAGLDMALLVHQAEVLRRDVDQLRARRLAHAQQKEALVRMLGGLDRRLAAAEARLNELLHPVPPGVP